MPLPVWWVPAGQAWQETAPVFDENRPTGQSVQRLAPPAAANFPISQLAQRLLPAKLEKVPRAHDTHDNELLDEVTRPVGQLPQTVAPTPENWPATQVVQTVDPREVLAVPAAQLVQRPPGARLNRPAAHC